MSFIEQEKPRETRPVSIVVCDQTGNQSLRPATAEFFPQKKEDTELMIVNPDEETRKQISSGELVYPSTDVWSFVLGEDKKPLFPS